MAEKCLEQSIHSTAAVEFKQILLMLQEKADGGVISIRFRRQ